MGARGGYIADDRGSAARTGHSHSWTGQVPWHNTTRMNEQDWDNVATTFEKEIFNVPANDTKGHIIGWVDRLAVPGLLQRILDAAWAAPCRCCRTGMIRCSRWT